MSETPDTSGLFKNAKQVMDDIKASTEQGIPLQGNLRDYFAAAAMQGLLSDTKRFGPESGLKSNDDISFWSYEIADAMIKERDPK